MNNQKAIIAIMSVLLAVAGAVYALQKDVSQNSANTKNNKDQINNITHRFERHQDNEHE